MKSVIKVLLIEDDEDDALLTREYLEEISNFKFDITWQPKLSLAKKLMLEGNHDIFLVDYRLGGENGLELIKFINEKGVLTPVIVLTGQGDLEVDIDASRFGASDYLVKGELNPSMLERSIRYAISQSKIIKELNEKEKKYRLLFERSIDPIFLANEKFKLLDVNKSFLNFFGLSREDSDAIKLENIFSNEEDCEYFKERLKEDEQIRDFEVTLITKNGEKKVCLLNCVFIPEQSLEFCCYQGIIHDLTMRKKAENDMLIAERLSLTGKIARTMAHEVRNPLTNLNLALDQLRSEIPVKSESGKLFGDIIERNAHRIEQLVSEMLNSSRTKELQLELYPVREILDDTVGLAMDRINLSGIKLSKNYDSALPSIMVDKEKIKIALLNIIINAIEAMDPHRGELTVAASLKDNRLIIEITDNGKGIVAVDLKKLFDPFFTDKPTGMGLGLTSTKNILNSHNATIEVVSELGRGTTFLIQFRIKS